MNTDCRFSHPHLVAMYAVCTDMEPFYIITEYMCNGSLLAFLRQDTKKITFDNLLSISAQVGRFSKLIACNDEKMIQMLMGIEFE